MVENYFYIDLQLITYLFSTTYKMLFFSHIIKMTIMNGGESFFYRPIANINLQHSLLELTINYKKVITYSIKKSSNLKFTDLHLLKKKKKKKKFNNRRNKLKNICKSLTGDFPRFFRPLINCRMQKVSFFIFVGSMQHACLRRNAINLVFYIYSRFSFLFFSFSFLNVIFQIVDTSCVLYKPIYIYIYSDREHGQQN